MFGFSVSKLFWVVDWLGGTVMRYVYLLTEITEMFVLSFVSAWNDRHSGARSILREVLSQVYYTGVQSLFIITALAVFSGSLVLIQGVSQFNVLGGYEVLGQFMVLTIVREGAPMLTSLVVIARSATAITAHLGSMRATGEIDVLKSMGIHPYSYLVFPRLVGGIIGLSALAFYFACAGVIGGYLVTAFFHEMSPLFYASIIIDSLGEFNGWLLFLVKVVFDGIFIFSIACFFGLQVRRDYTEVPKMTTQAVMRCLTYVLIFNITASIVFYAIGLKAVVIF